MSIASTEGLEGRVEALERRNRQLVAALASTGPVLLLVALGGYVLPLRAKAETSASVSDLSGLRGRLAALESSTADLASRTAIPASRPASTNRPAAAPLPDRIECESLVVKSPDGAPSIVLQASPEEATINVSAGDNAPSMTLRCGSSGAKRHSSSIAIRGPDPTRGSLVLFLAPLDETGESLTPNLSLLGKGCRTFVDDSGVRVAGEGLRTNYSSSGLDVSTGTGDGFRSLASLHVGRTGGRMVLSDYAGKKCARLNTDAGVASLSLSEQTHRGGIYMIAGEDGSQLRIADKQDRGAVSLSADAESSALTLVDRKDQLRVSLQASLATSGLLLWDDRTKGGVFLRADTERSSVAIADRDGQDRVVLGPADTVVTSGPRKGAKVTSPPSSIHLFDSEGKVTWQAP